MYIYSVLRMLKMKMDDANEEKRGASRGVLKVLQAGKVLHEPGSKN